MKIEVKNVGKKFKNNYILKNINMTFEDGKIYGFSGRNGSGKSVLLKIICGIYAPNEGEILFDNKNYNHSNMFVPSLRALIEKPCFFPDLSGFENLKLLAKIQNKISDEDIYKAMEIVNIIEEKDKKYSNYSLGLKQKLGIAQAIMENPHVLILDEPFNGIENTSVKKITNYLLEEKKKGKIIIISTHIKEDLEKLSDILYYFDNGNIEIKELSNWEGNIVEWNLLNI